MTGTKSTWVSIRDGFEALFSPEAKAAVDFAHAVASDSEAQAKGNLATAFTNGTAAFVATVGALEAKIIAAGTAFLATIIGAEVVIVKKDASAELNPPA